MSQTKHSPGPWKMCAAREGRCPCMAIMSVGGDHPVARIESGEWGDNYPSIRLVGGSIDRKAEAYMEQIDYGHIPEEEALANGRLMAAAPEMLELLEAIIHDVDAGRNPSFQRARLAIKKVEEGK